MNKKQLFGMIMSVGVLVAVFLLPIPEGLTDVGFITIGLLIFFLIRFGSTLFQLLANQGLLVELRCLSSQRLVL